MIGARLVPHLYFAGDCEAALRFYESCGLGHVRALQRYEGAAATRAGEAYRGKVLHAELEGPGVLLYAGDGPDSEPMKGCALLLELEDTLCASTLFDALSTGGRVTVAFGDKPWGRYGNFTDRFGVQWAVLVRVAS
jgi:PhnB protein